MLMSGGLLPDQQKREKTPIQNTSFLMRRTSRRDILPQRQQDILQTWWRKGPEDRIRVEVYPEGKLGDELSAIHQVSYGGIDFARVSLATVAENGSDAEVLMLPYLYSGREHMWKDVRRTVRNRNAL